MKTQEECHEQGVSCDELSCQECCPHDESDHYVCMDCGKELDPGVDIDAAEYLLDPDR